MYEYTISHAFVQIFHISLQLPFFITNKRVEVLNLPSVFEVHVFHRLEKKIHGLQENSGSGK